MKNLILYPRLATNQVVEIKGEKYRAGIWRQSGKITYEFIYLGENGLNNFEKSEKEVSDAIKKGIIK
jgi:hypothetical protein